MHVRSFLSLLRCSLVLAAVTSSSGGTTVEHEKEGQAPPLLSAFLTNISSSVLLHDGNSIPLVGLGLSLTAEVTYQAVHWALDAGYRLMDTAAEEDTYGNEDEVGRAIRDYLSMHANDNDQGATTTTKRNRDHVFVTTKLWDDSHGFWPTLESFDESYESLNIGTIDLYLIHSPFGGRLVETWDALLYLQSKGYVQSIGVSNFGVEHLQTLEMGGRPLPVVNQIEMHPLVYRKRSNLIDYCRQRNIRIQAYGSLMHGYEEWLTQPHVLVDMAARYQKNTSQILLKWALQRDFMIIPKSSHQHRIVENSLLYDFELSQEDMATLDSWGDQVPEEEDRNIYKQDWNWNPIDEAPVHKGRMNYWPKFEGVDEIHYSNGIDEEEDEEEGSGGDEL